MATKKANKPKSVETSTKPSEPVIHTLGGITIAKMSLLAFLICACVLTVAGILSNKYFVAQVNAQRHDLLQAQADHIAAHLAGHIQGYVDVVDSVLREPELIDALEQGNTVALDNWKARFSESFAVARRLYFVRPGEHDPDTDVIPPVSYACLDLVRHTESSPDEMRMEVHLLGREHQHIDFVRPVYGDDGIIASLIVSLETRTLQPWLKQLVSQGVHLELQQRADSGGELLLAAQGLSGVREDGKQYVSLIAGTAWQVAFWPEPRSVVLPDGASAGFWLVGGIAVAIIAIVFLVFSLLVGRILHSDLTNLIKNFYDWNNRKPIHSSSNMRMAEFREAVAIMDQQMQAAAVSRSKVASNDSRDEAQKAGEKVKEEVIEEVMFMADGGITLEEVDDDDSDVANEDKNK